MDFEVDSGFSGLLRLTFYAATDLVVRHNMKIRDPRLFWQTLQNGQMAWLAYERIWRYVASSQVQLNRIYRLWQQSSQIKIEAGTANSDELFQQKRLNMEQVISDIHFLVLCLDKIWKLIDRLTGTSLCPELKTARQFKKTIRPFLKPYLEARDTFEHYDEQVIGGDPRKKGPGSQKVLLKAGVGFSFGDKPPIKIDEAFNQELLRLLEMFDWRIYDDIIAKSKSV